MQTPRQAGFSYLSLPRSDINPLDLLVKTGAGKVHYMGASIADLFIPVNAAMPKIKKNLRLPDNISGEEMLDVKVESEFGVLKGLADILHGGGSINYNLDKSSKYMFTLKDARLDNINMVFLDFFINDAALNDKAKTFADLLLHNDIFVIYETLKSNAFELGAQSSAEMGIGNNVSVDNMAQLNASIDRSAKHGLAQSYNGKETLVVALKAAQILYKKSWWWNKKEANYHLKVSENIKEVKGPDDYPVDALQCDIVEVEKL
jgi:hypothetical protein